MADAQKAPGIALIFGEEIWFIPAKDYAEVTKNIDRIKDVLVGENGPFKNSARKLTQGDYLELAKLETDDIKSLLTKGITIRPMGR